jgi:hypothetical protein
MVHQPSAVRPFVQQVSDGGARVDISNVAVVLDLLDSVEGT